MRNMKDSGIEWIGEIPEDWNICKLKNIAELYTGNSIKDDEKELYCDKVNAYSYIATKDIDVNTSSVNYDNGMYTKIDDYKFKIATKDSTLLCIEGGSAGKKITYLKEDVSFINKLCCIKSNKINSKYQFYYLKSPSFSSEFNLNISGLIGGVSIGKLKEFPITLPSIEEQELIADYLDSKISEIDNIILKTKETIEEYKKYKQSIITDAVTKGLNPNVEMKDSGIEWIGDIPKDWIITKVKHLSPVSRGASPRPIDDSKYFDENGEYVWTRIADISKCNKYFTKYHEYMSELGSSKTVKIEENTLFLSICATVGKPIISKVKCCIHDGFVYFPELNKKYNEFLYYIFESGLCFKGLGKMGTQLNLNRETVGNIIVPLPSDIEMYNIVNFINEKCSKLDNLITKKEELITQLENYKKSLIYECVTGKKEVSPAYAY